MAKFDQEGLRAALKSGNIPVSNDEIRHLEGVLRALAQQYRTRKIALAQDLKRQSTKLEATKNFLVAQLESEPLLYAFEAETAQIIKRLFDAVQHGMEFLKHEREKRKVRGDDSETILFIHDRIAGNHQ